MKTVLFILVAFLWVGFKSYKKKLESLANLEDSSNEPVPNRETVKSAFESLFENEEPSFESLFSSFDKGSTNSTAYSQENGTQVPFADEVHRAGIDSYECDSCTQEKVVSEKSKSVAPIAETSVLRESGANFDLRQAIIYQTILSNKYLDEVHCIDN